jgi:hypothetical protein
VAAQYSTLFALACTVQLFSYFCAHFCVCTTCLLHIISLQDSFLACDSCTELKIPEFSGSNDIDLCNLLVNDPLNSNSVLTFADLSGFTDVNHNNFNNLSNDVINIFGLNFAYSEFSHLITCFSKNNCATCTALISNYFTYVNSHVGFLPLFPQLWNSLPIELRTSPSLYIFRRKLKTHLFAKAYPPFFFHFLMPTLSIP